MSCKAQNIVPYFTNADVDYHVDNSGDYYKDVDNDFNPFVGTWQWVNGNNSLTFVFKKEININDGDGYTYDRLVGEYQYIENGVEKVNTLADINNPNLSPYQHKISGDHILTKYYRRAVCNTCDENERRVQVLIEHPDDNGIMGWLILRHVTVSGVEKIEVKVFDGPKLPSTANGPVKIDIPFDDYVLIKQ